MLNFWLFKNMFLLIESTNKNLIIILNLRPDFNMRENQNVYYVFFKSGNSIEIDYLTLSKCLEKIQFYFLLTQ